MLSGVSCLADGGTTISARESFDSPNVWDKSGLSGYLVCLVHLVSLMQPNKPDRPNRPNERDRLAGFFSILPLDIWDLPFNRSQPRISKVSIDLRKTPAPVKLSD